MVHHFGLQCGECHQNKSWLMYLSLNVASLIIFFIFTSFLLAFAGFNMLLQLECVVATQLRRAVVLNLWVITPKGVIWHFKRGNINFQNKKEVTSMANVVMRFYSKSLNMFHS